MSSGAQAVNQDLLMQAFLDALPEAGEKPRLLLHCCCAPCSTAVLERLSRKLAVTLFYYNPNIDSAQEHERRAGELARLAEASGLAEGTVILPYAPDSFYQAVRGLEDEPEGGLRCQSCFHLRLREAARYAKREGYPLFTTTLTISPRKDAALLNRLGESIAHEEGVAFLASDFKKRGGFLRSTQLSRTYGLYRQDYCGCVFSRAQRDGRLSSAGPKSGS
ncbi:MAG: epoxyqueuosine reductase QueH [Christensenellales bacterium]